MEISMREKSKRKQPECRNFKILFYRRSAFMMIINKSSLASLKRFVGNFKEQNQIKRVEALSSRNKCSKSRLVRYLVDFLCTLLI